MKKTLLAVITLVALTIGVNTFADPCNNPCNDPCKNPCDNPCQNEKTYKSQCDDPCEKEKKCDPCEDITGCAEDWLCYSSLQEYFSQMGFTDCQKEEAMRAIEEFKCETQEFRNNNCECQSKSDCRTYRNALKDLDCKMKKIVTECQKDEYKEVKKSVKDQIKCVHKCLINPFSSCKCSCK